MDAPELFKTFTLSVDSLLSIVLVNVETTAEVKPAIPDVSSELTASELSAFNWLLFNAAITALVSALAFVELKPTKAVVLNLDNPVLSIAVISA